MQAFLSCQSKIHCQTLLTDEVPVFKRHIHVKPQMSSRLFAIFYHGWLSCFEFQRINSLEQRPVPILRSAVQSACWSLKNPSKLSTQTPTFFCNFNNWTRLQWVHDSPHNLVWSGFHWKLTLLLAELGYKETTKLSFFSRIYKSAFSSYVTTSQEILRALKH